MKGASQIAPFGLRMPEELKDAISKRASENGRSMNAEIVQILEDYLASDDRRSRGLGLTGVSENQMEYIIDTMTQKLVDKVGEALAADKKPT